MPKMNAKEKNAANALKIMGKHKAPAKVEKAKPAKVEKVKTEKSGVNVTRLHDAAAIWGRFTDDMMATLDKGNKAPDAATAIAFVLSCTYVDQEKGLAFSDAVPKMKNEKQVRFIVNFVKKFYAGAEKYISPIIREYVDCLDSALVK